MFGGLGGFNPLGVSELKTLAAAPVEPARPASARASTFGDIDDEIDAIDAVDLELFPIFEEEAQELLPKLDGQLRDWLREPHANAHAAACMRTLHTLKGGARLAGAMRLGEMAHRLETRIERLTAIDAAAATAEDIEALQAVSDAMTNAFEALRSRDAQAYSDAVAAATAPMAATARPDEPARAAMAEAPVFVATPIVEPVPAAEVPQPDDAAPAGADAAKAPRKRSPPATRATPAPSAAAAVAAAATPSRRRRCRPSRRRSTGRASRARPATVARPVERTLATQSAVRVRAPLLDRLVNQAGEVSITRSRIESGVGQMKGSLVRPDREPRATARPAARHRAAGRGADELASRGGEGRFAGVRPARVRPLHALPGADADDGRVGQRRRHGAANAAALDRAGRGRTGRRRRA